MPAAELLIPFLIAFAIFAFVPRPGMLHALAQTIPSGKPAGWYAAIGFHLAGFGHIAAAVFGVTILLQVTPALFGIMKAVGAAYLIWIGVRSLIGQAPLAGPSGPASGAEAASALKDSTVVEVRP